MTSTRLQPTIAALAFTAVLISAVASPAWAQAPVGRGARVVHVGYTAFSNEPTEELAQFHSYLDRLRTGINRLLTANGRPPIQFVVHAGNNYQVLAWLRSGELDAAVVSAFSAYLLRREGLVEPLVEFNTASNAARTDMGRHPVIGGCGDGSTGNTLTAFHDYLGTLRQATADAQSSAEPRARRGTLSMLSHLSTSGFIVPLLYVDRWLDGQSLKRAQQNEFWRLFFADVTFTMTQTRGDVVTSRCPGAAASFWFSDGVNEPEGCRDGGCVVALPLSSTAPASSIGVSPFLMPHDVFVVSRALIEDLSGRGALDPVLLAQEVAERAASGKPLSQTIQAVHAPVHENFARELAPLFAPNHGAPNLRRAIDRWYRNGQFEFTIPESIQLLRQDQINSGVARLSLVLPGGGVKGLYQAVVLDRLYEKYLQNPSAQDEPPREPRSKLTVTNVIGTSGGAMVGLFASLIPPSKGKPGIAEDLQKAAQSVFSPFDLARALSVLVILGIWVCVFRFAAMIGLYDAFRPPSRTAPLPIPLALYLLGLVPTAALLMRLVQPEVAEVVSKSERVLFGLAVLVIHFTLSCGSRVSSTAVGAHARESVDLIRSCGAVVGCLSGVCVVVAIAISFVDGGQGFVAGPSAASTIAASGFLLQAVYILLACLSGRWGVAFERMDDYLRGALLIAGGMIAVAVLMSVALLGGWTTTLELTSQYWAALAVCSLLTAGLILLLARGSHRTLIWQTLTELTTVQAGRLTASPLSKATLFVGFAVLCWTAIVAPALYSNARALDAFTDVVKKRQGGHPTMHANLIVTTSLLQNAHCESGMVRPSGHLYHCFEGTAGCVRNPGDRWVVQDAPSLEMLVDSTFASGSPFPVFAAHHVVVGDGCRAALIDGGYAHNVPLRAAQIGDARQVLILHSTPLETAVSPPSTRRFLGLLLQGSPRLLSFMFTRAQESDREAARQMMVVALAPSARPEDFPVLTDFSAGTRDAMIKAATRDLAANARIGTVVHWGLPAGMPIGTSPP